MSQTSAKQVAEWLIWHANNHGELMTNLRLQKLLYYVQAWHLAIKNKPLFDEDFQAWIHGPVIAPLYGMYKHFGGAPIVTSTPIDDIEDLPEPSLPGEEKSHVLEVLSAYGDLSTWQLERLTHEERPWIEARRGLPLDAPCKNIISKNSMQSFYRAMLNEQESNTASK